VIEIGEATKLEFQKLMNFSFVYHKIITICLIPVLLKLDRIAPKGAILRSKGVKILNHSSITELTSAAYFMTC